MALSLYLAFDAELNDKGVWRAVEDAAIAALHLLSLKQMCQLEWASCQLKPKQMTSRLNTLFMKRALESVDTCSREDMMNISQGFRQK